MLPSLRRRDESGTDVAIHLEQYKRAGDGTGEVTMKHRTRTSTYIYQREHENSAMQVSLFLNLSSNMMV